MDVVLFGKSPQRRFDLMFIADAAWTLGDFERHNLRCEIAEKEKKKKFGLWLQLEARECLSAGMPPHLPREKAASKRLRWPGSRPTPRAKEGSPGDKQTQPGDSQTAGGQSLCPSGT
ncbi:hypothetical protein EYF80_031506 [Liparis tanakae]|uniref:Uncharacterized protein n=1 Tax=Liparis tanakae TaxID=230148 RepID=A0A4Z2GXK9_9TELE|nr:hypothetical protein EYF80_031506 [Liparis tanakae]